MNVSIRADLVVVLAELAEMEPEMRVGQLVANLSYLAMDYANSAIWDVEDDELLAAAREHLACLRAARGPAAGPISDEAIPSSSAVPASGSRSTSQR